MKKALVTGITGQDGSYLAELLLNEGYEVFGLIRRLSVPNTKNIGGVLDRIRLQDGDLQDQNSLINIIRNVDPDEIYNLAAQSFVPSSFNQPVLTAEVNAVGVVKILDAIRAINPEIKFYQASTSEMFGKVQESPQTEETPFYPRSPYGVSKVYAYWITRNYREGYSMFNCNGILFNHESPRRGKEFVSRKISSCVAGIARGLDNTLLLGNLDARRDWGFAGDYVRAMWLMLQQEQPDDYVIATGHSHSIRDFLDLAFGIVNLEYEIVDLHELTGEEADRRVEELRRQKDKVFVVQHPMFYRPAEVQELLGNPKKAKTKLGWEPGMSFAELVKAMVEEDLKEVE